MTQATPRTAATSPASRIPLFAVVEACKLVNARSHAHAAVQNALMLAGSNQPLYVAITTAIACAGHVGVLRHVFEAYAIGEAA